MNDRTLDKPPLGKPLIGTVIVLVLAAASGAWYWHSRTGPLPSVPLGEPPAAPPPPEARIEHPVPAASAASPKTALPDLSDSDKPVGDALSAAVPGLPVTQYLVPDGIIRHLVVTVDNLPRQKVAVDKRPVVPAPGAFIVDGDELHATLDSRNFRRYQPLVELLGKADLRRVAQVYFDFYPLFQRAYQDLGYPTGYFNDRLVEAIDVLLATPQVTGPIELSRPNVMYVFTDPALEGLPAGQKVLIRMGPDNAAAVKAKLMELRAIITAAAPKH